MKKVINVALCDARDVTEESFSGFENVTINAAAVITGPKAKELMGRYNVVINSAAIIEVPDGEDIRLQTINGKGEIGPDADGRGVFLLVNGKLTVQDGSYDALESYYRILVNGKAIVPRSYRGRLSKMEVNGKTVYYPDGAFVLNGDTEVNDLFLMRASRDNYYCAGDLFFLDADIDTGKVLEKGMRFSAHRIVASETLLRKLVAQFDEETEVICVPDGTRRVDDDVDLSMRTIRRFGSRLFVSGDVRIEDGEALAALEYLYADGEVCVAQSLAEEFEKVESVCDRLTVIDPEKGYISDRPAVKIGRTALRKYPHGLNVSDCASVTLAEELSAEEITEKLKISDCAVVLCSAEQEEAVNLVAEDVSAIRVRAADEGSDVEEEGAGGSLKNAFGKLREVFGELRDIQMVNAVTYKM